MKHGAAMRAYDTSIADPVADGDRLLALWGTGLSHRDRPRAKLAWYYRSNPEGPPLVVTLRHGDPATFVGVAAAGPRRLVHGARTYRAGAMVDFVVLPEHRTLFPAMLLQKAICREALATHDLLFGLPNRKSVAAILRVGYRLLGPRTRRVRVLRSAPYLSRLLPPSLAAVAGPVLDWFRMGTARLRRLAAPGFRGEWLDRPDARFDDLWSRARDPGVLTGVRDAAFLAWRFVDCPLRRHRFFALASPTDGRLAAYAVCETQQHVMQVRDFLVDPAWAGAWSRLWADLSCEAHDRGCASVAVDFLGPEATQSRLAAAGFLDRGEQPVYAVLPEEVATFASPERWYLTDADDDV